jgi:hypothetical protein
MATIRWAAAILLLGLASRANAQARHPVDMNPTTLEGFEALCEYEFSTENIERSIVALKASASVNVPARVQNLERQLDQAKAQLADCKARAPQAAAAFQKQKAKEDAALAEQKRDQDEQAARVATRRARRAAASPGNRRTALSAELCALRALRSETTAEIATDKRYARVGGAVDLSHRYQLQRELRDVDEQMSSTKAEIEALRLKPTACSDALVGPLSTCVNIGWNAEAGIGGSHEPVNDECAGDNVTSWLDLLDFGAD